MKEFVEALWSVWTDVFGGAYLYLLLIVTIVTLFRFFVIIFQKVLAEKSYPALFHLLGMKSIYDERAKDLFKFACFTVLIFTAGFLFFNMFDFTVGQFLLTLFLTVFIKQIYTVAVTILIIALVFVFACVCFLLGIGKKSKQQKKTKKKPEYRNGRRIEDAEIVED